MGDNKRKNKTGPQEAQGQQQKWRPKVESSTTRPATSEAPQPKKKELLRSIIDHIKVDYDNTNKTHELDVNFRIPMRVFCDDSNFKPKTLRLDYSTVTLFAKFLG
jgi:hypothetical protein